MKAASRILAPITGPKMLGADFNRNLRSPLAQVAVGHHLNNAGLRLVAPTKPTHGLSVLDAYGATPRLANGATCTTQPKDDSSDHGSVLIVT